MFNFFNKKNLEQKELLYTIGKESKIYSSANIINPLKDEKLIEIGKYTHIRGELLLFKHGGKIKIGDYCYVGFNSFIWAGKEITIKDRVLIGHNCNIFDNDIHPIDDYQLRHEQYKHIITKGQMKEIKLNDKEITIEEDVWIGANVTILKGVKIGKASVIGANSVVTKDIEAYSIYAGNPAKRIRGIKNAK